MEVLKERSIDERRVHNLASAWHTWMKPIIEYMQHGILPNDHEEAKKVRIKAPSYTILDGVLYQKGFMSPRLKCMDETTYKESLRGTHCDLAGTHKGATALPGKILWMAIY